MKILKKIMLASALSLTVVASSYAAEAPLTESTPKMFARASFQDCSFNAAEGSATLVFLHVTPEVYKEAASRIDIPLFEMSEKNEAQKFVISGKRLIVMTADSELSFGNTNFTNVTTECHAAITAPELLASLSKSRVPVYDTAIDATSSGRIEKDAKMRHGKLQGIDFFMTRCAGVIPPIDAAISFDPTSHIIVEEDVKISESAQTLTMTMARRFLDHPLRTRVSFEGCSFRYAPVMCASTNFHRLTPSLLDQIRSTAKEALGGDNLLEKALEGDTKLDMEAVQAWKKAVTLKAPKSLRGELISTFTGNTFTQPVLVVDLTVLPSASAVGTAVINVTGIEGTYSNAAAFSGASALNVDLLHGGNTFNMTGFLSGLDSQKE